MKKILLLGGSRYILPVIKAIHELGYYAITCDYLPDNIAHKYSDEYHNISIIEKERVLELAIKLNIDGIMSFACDPGVETAAYVAENMGLPFAGNYESVCILQNKALFRKFLYDNGFNVPKANGYSDYNSALIDISNYSLPVIVKPVDSAGSKGVTKVDDLLNLKDAIDYAIKYSKTKTFIIEEFITQQGYSSDTDCFSIDGKLVFASFACQRFDQKAINPYTPSAYSWPSNMPLNIQEQLRNELQRLITLLNLKTSIYNVETRQGTDGKPYIMEFTPRGGGNRLSEVLKLASGVDLITNAVKASVGDKIIEINGDPSYNGYFAEIILHSRKEGQFQKLWINEDIKKYVIELDLWINKGSTIYGFTGANEAIGTIIFKFDSNEQVEKVLNNVEQNVKVIIK